MKHVVIPNFCPIINILLYLPKSNSILLTSINFFASIVHINIAYTTSRIDKSQSIARDRLQRLFDGSQSRFANGNQVKGGKRIIVCRRGSGIKRRTSVFGQQQLARTRVVSLLSKSLRLRRSSFSEIDVEDPCQDRRNSLNDQLTLRPRRGGVGYTHSYSLPRPPLSSQVRTAGGAKCRKTVFRTTYCATALNFLRKGRRGF